MDGTSVWGPGCGLLREPPRSSPLQPQVPYELDRRNFGGEAPGFGVSVSLAPSAPRTRPECGVNKTDDEAVGPSPPPLLTSPRPSLLNLVSPGLTEGSSRLTSEVVHRDLHVRVVSTDPSQTGERLPRLTGRRGKTRGVLESGEVERGPRLPKNVLLLHRECSLFRPEVGGEPTGGRRVSPRTSVSPTLPTGVETPAPGPSTLPGSLGHPVCPSLYS